MDARELRLISAQARRLRGLIRGDHEDLAAALSACEAMGSQPYVARLLTELGQLTGDAAMIERGLDGLEALGDVEQSARVAAERKANALASAGSRPSSAGR
jgi:hypothetical protein